MGSAKLGFLPNESQYFPPEFGCSLHVKELPQCMHELYDRRVCLDKRKDSQLRAQSQSLVLESGNVLFGASLPIEFGTHLLRRKPLLKVHEGLVNCIALMYRQGGVCVVHSVSLWRGLCVVVVSVRVRSLDMCGLQR